MSVQVFSNDRNLYVGMTIDGIRSDATKKESEKAKLIELFNQANINSNSVIEPEEIKAYDENQAGEKSQKKSKFSVPNS